MKHDVTLCENIVVPWTMKARLRKTSLGLNVRGSTLCRAEAYSTFLTETGVTEMRSSSLRLPRLRLEQPIINILANP
jgi:hypothetical protein